MIYLIVLTVIFTYYIFKAFSGPFCFSSLKKNSKLEIFNSNLNYNFFVLNTKQNNIRLMCFFFNLTLIIFFSIIDCVTFCSSEQNLDQDMDNSSESSDFSDQDSFNIWMDNALKIREDFEMSFQKEEKTIKDNSTLNSKDEALSSVKDIWTFQKKFTERFYEIQMGESAYKSSMPSSIYKDIFCLLKDTLQKQFLFIKKCEEVVILSKKGDSTPKLTGEEIVNFEIYKTLSLSNLENLEKYGNNFAWSSAESMDLDRSSIDSSNDGKQEEC